MGKVSIIIPAREEPYLVPTIVDLLGQARGDVEILPVLDGWRPLSGIVTDPRVRFLGWDEPRGLRHAINAGMAEATGDWVMKIDAHCSVSEGYDLALQAECDDDWVVVPEKYSLNADTWERYRRPWQYFYLTFPWDPSLNYPGLHDKEAGKVWSERGAGVEVDEILSYQGSCWFLSRRHWERIGPMDAEHYYTAQEPQEIGLATWLSGGTVVINKRVWYAHLWKGRGHKRGFATDKRRWMRAMRYSAEYWMGNQYPRRTRDFAWLVERFWPLLQDCKYGPWPADWDNPAYRARRVA